MAVDLVLSFLIPLLLPPICHLIHFASICTEIIYLSHVMFQHSPPLVQPLVMMTFMLQYGCNSLCTASSNGHLEVVKVLIEAGANVNQGDKVDRCVHVCMCVACACV